MAVAAFSDVVEVFFLLLPRNNTSSTPPMFVGEGAWVFGLPGGERVGAASDSLTAHGSSPTPSCF